MAKLAISHGKCFTPLRTIDDCLILIHEDKLKYVGPFKQDLLADDTELFDASGTYVCPGLIDIHVNGGAGAETIDGTTEALETIREFHFNHGATAIVPTLLSTDIERTLSVLGLIGKLQGQVDANSSRIIGAHLEGPYISKQQKGAHNITQIRDANYVEYSRLFDYHTSISIITAAPEIPGVLDLAKTLQSEKTVFSIGHSDAKYEHAIEAIEAGFSMVTHIYSVLSTITRDHLTKVPGVIEAALLHDDFTVEVIADNMHLPPSLIQLILKVKPIDRIIVASDAIRAAGLTDGKYLMGNKEENHQIIVEDGIAKTMDKKLLAGSTVTIEESIKNIVNASGITINDAIRTVTLNPAKLLGVDDNFGSLTPGKKADITILNKDFTVHSIVLDGKLTPFHHNNP